KVYETTVNINSVGYSQIMFIAVVDKTTLVASPGKDYVVDALDKANGKKKSKVKKELIELIEKADGKQSMWLAALSTGLAIGPLADNDKAKEVLDKIKHVTGSVSITDEVKTEFIINAKSKDNAKELSTMIDDGLGKAKLFLGFAAAQNKQLE